MYCGKMNENIESYFDGLEVQDKCSWEFCTLRVGPFGTLAYKALKVFQRAQLFKANSEQAAHVSKLSFASAKMIYSFFFR